MDICNYLVYRMIVGKESLISIQYAYNLVGLQLQMLTKPNTFY